MGDKRQAHNCHLPLPIYVGKEKKGTPRQAHTFLSLNQKDKKCTFQKPKKKVRPKPITSGGLALDQN